MVILVAGRANFAALRSRPNPRPPETQTQLTTGAAFYTIDVCRNTGRAFSRVRGDLAPSCICEHLTSQSRGHGTRMWKQQVCEEYDGYRRHHHTTHRSHMWVDSKRSCSFRVVSSAARGFAISKNDISLQSCTSTSMTLMQVCSGVVCQT